MRLNSTKTPWTSSPPPNFIWIRS